MRKLFLLFTLLSFFSSANAQDEVIFSFHSDVITELNGDLVVTENIKVYANGDQIKRGIFRELPLENNTRTDAGRLPSYKVLSVKQNGAPSKYHTETKSGNFYIYVGDKNVLLKPGAYDYEIKYLAQKQVGFFETYDEVYWNTTGNSWSFPIQSATATLHFPPNTKALQQSCYTGSYGSADKNCTVTEQTDSSISWEAKNLLAGQGLTIAAGFNKGVVTPPSLSSAGFLEKNGAWLLLASIFSVLFGYYYFTWRKHGVDPPKPVPYPQWNVPHNLSPGSLGMLKNERVTMEMLVGSLVNLAVRGMIRIEETNNKFLGLFNNRQYTLVSLAKSSENIPSEEKILLTHFFGKGIKRTITNKYDKSIEEAVDAYRKELKKKHDALINKGANYNFLLLPLLLIIIGFIIMFYLVFIRSANVSYNIIPFLLFAIVGVASLIFYYYLIKKPTPEKLNMQSDIEGFKMYLGMAEEKQLQHFNPPAITPQVFESLLPYAMVLGVDKIWGNKFEQSLVNSLVAPTYHAGWYTGQHFTPGSFGGNISSSLRNTLAAASTAPSSSGSSGSGGGGFSGGGGGGGGGGGW